MSATETKPLLSVRHLSKKFPVGKDFFGRANKFVHAVNDVSFDIMPGETFSLVGESGLDRTVGDKAVIPRGRDIAGGKLFLQIS